MTWIKKKGSAPLSGAAEQAFGAALEGCEDFAEHGGERARGDGGKKRAVEGVVDGKPDLRPLLAVGLEGPQNVEPAQRPVERLDFDAPRESVAGGAVGVAHVEAGNADRHA